MSRKEFSKPTRRAGLKRSGMGCEASGPFYGLEEGQRCGRLLSYGVEFDHVLACSNGGDNSLSNMLCVCKRCHAFKTNKRDIPRAAKTVRIQDKHLGISKPKFKWPKRKFGT